MIIKAKCVLASQNLLSTISNQHRIFMIFFMIFMKIEIYCYYREYLIRVRIRFDLRIRNYQFSRLQKKS